MPLCYVLWNDEFSSGSPFVERVEKPEQCCKTPDERDDVDGKEFWEFKVENPHCRQKTKHEDIVPAVVKVKRQEPEQNGIAFILVSRNLNLPQFPFALKDVFIKLAKFGAEEEQFLEKNDAKKEQVEREDPLA